MRYHDLKPKPLLLGLEMHLDMDILGYTPLKSCINTLTNSLLTFAEYSQTELRLSHSPYCSLCSPKVGNNHVWRKAGFQNTRSAMRINHISILSDNAIEQK